MVETVAFQEDGFVSATEVLIRAAEQGYRITEVPMTLHARKIGRTKMKILRTIRGHLRLISTTTVRRIQSALKTRSSVATRNGGLSLRKSRKSLTSVGRTPFVSPKHSQVRSI